MIVGLIIGNTMGLMGHLGVPNAQLHNSLYFLLLGLGVDDAFVLASEFGRRTMLHPELSMAERVARAACSGGMSVLVTPATDVLALLVGVTSVLPALGWLLTWAGVAIVFTDCLHGCACGLRHDVTSSSCALHMPDGVVALSTAEESWACGFSPAL